jgi:NADH-quinone oxidoreductase subunit M
MFSSAGLPMLNGFIGEFTILQGAYIANVWWAVAAGSGIVLGAAYLLWLYQRTMLGEITNEKNRAVRDLNLREWAYFTPLIILAFWIGIYPKPYFDILEKPVQKLVQRVNPGALKQTAPVQAETAPAPAADAPGGMH